MNCPYELKTVTKYISRFNDAKPKAWLPEKTSESALNSRLYFANLQYNLKLLCTVSSSSLFEVGKLGLNRTFFLLFFFDPNNLMKDLLTHSRVAIKE